MRWPAPIFVVSLFVVLIGMVAIPGYKPGYNDRYYLPSERPSNIGFAAADRHFSASPDEPRHPDGRGRPRHAQSRRHAGAERGRPERDAHRGHRDGAEHHPAAGNSDPAQLDSVPDQHPGPDHHTEPAVPAGQMANQLKMADDDATILDRHLGEAVPSSRSADQAHAGLGSQASQETYWRPPTSCETTSRTSTTSSGRCAATSTGRRHCFDIPVCSASGRCSTPSTASTK